MMVRNRRSHLTLAILALGFTAFVRPVAAQTDIPTIKIDISRSEEMKPFAEKAETAARDWYPKIVTLLGSGPKNPPKQITITFDPTYKGVAAASGARIVCSPEWFGKHPDDVGAIVHEIAHVVQAYPKYNPVWLVEGIADYVRWFNYEPEDKRPHPNPAKVSARDSYRTTGAFLDWASRKYDKDLVKKLDHALKEATYTEDVWKQYTGKTLDELNTEWLASLKAPEASAVVK